MVVLSDQDLSSIFAALRSQEERFYCSKDYLRQDFQSCQVDSEVAEGFMCSASSSGSSTSSRLNNLWREKICEWSYQVVDHFNFSREVVAIAVNCLDRYLAVRTVNRKTFQLAAMTCLFMSIKLNESRTLRLSTFLELSRGYFEAEHVIDMEKDICSALDWHMHPPTSITIAKYLRLLLPTSIEKTDEIIEIARFLTEIAVCDYSSFITKKPTSIATAAILSGMELVGSKNISQEEFHAFYTRVGKVAGLNCNDPEVLECRASMIQSFTHGGFSGDTFGNDSTTDRYCSGTGSPTFVNDAS